MAIKNMTIRIDPELHKVLRVKLAQEDKSFQEWAEERIKEYVDWKEEENE